MALLKCNAVSLGYDSKIILTDLSFDVNQRDYLCIVGENGSGKSTLMKTILGLKEPIKGTIEFGDGLNKKKIGYLPQQTLVQRDFPASVWEIVLSGTLGKKGFHPFYSKADKSKAEMNMKKMGIADLAKRSYRELSGGQQQRVLLARALCATEKMLLLDEPVSGLDPKVTAEMYSLIKELNNNGTTIIMISHDISCALDFASHILHIGNDIFFGTKEEYILNNKISTFVNISGGEQNA
ncbi:MAG: metal ABC transporter ATP-binding protein [Eubacterium sp.]